MGRASKCQSWAHQFLTISKYSCYYKLNNKILLLPLGKAYSKLNPDRVTDLVLIIEQILEKEIEESKRWVDLEKENSTYKRDLTKRIELIYWVLENLKNPDTKICNLIESKMNEVILRINRTYSITEADKLHSELRIWDWIFYQVCSNVIKSQ